jgi:hypothetical protein
LIASGTRLAGSSGAADDDSAAELLGAALDDSAALLEAALLEAAGVLAAALLVVLEALVLSLSLPHALMSRPSETTATSASRGLR